MIRYTDSENRVIPCRDHRFLPLLHYATGVSASDPMRLCMLWQASRACAALPGAMAEVGVYRGGSAYVLAQAASGKPLHLFDTFSGMPDGSDPAMGDQHQAGDFADTSVEGVRAYLVDCPAVVLHPGVFPESAVGLERESFALAHIDVDLYGSTLACLEWLWPRMVPCGVVLVDDYGFLRTAGARRAVDDFFEDRAAVPMALATGQALIVRPS